MGSLNIKVSAQEVKRVALELKRLGKVTRKTKLNKKEPAFNQPYLPGMDEWSKKQPPGGNDMLLRGLIKTAKDYIATMKKELKQFQDIAGNCQREALKITNKMAAHEINAQAFEAQKQANRRKQLIYELLDALMTVDSGDFAEAERIKKEIEALFLEKPQDYESLDTEDKQDWMKYMDVYKNQMEDFNHKTKGNSFGVHQEPKALHKEKIKNSGSSGFSGALDDTPSRDGQTNFTPKKFQTYWQT